MALAGCLTIGFVSVTLLIHAQPYNDQVIRDILLPADCRAPCFMGLQPGFTPMKEVYRHLESHPWVGKITSYIDSGCCTIAMNWWWNGKQPPWLENGTNTIYFDYDPTTGIQTVQNIALHTRIPVGYAILTLGGWQPTDSGALKGRNNALVEMVYREHFVHITTTLDCPISRWRLWEAPMTLALNISSTNLANMKPIKMVC